jgi:hypothetical protein
MWTNGIGVSTVDHVWSVKNGFLPCNILDWYEKQTEYGGQYDSIEIPERKSVELKAIDSLESLFKALGDEADEQIYIDFRGKYGDLTELDKLLRGTKPEDLAIKERLCAFVVTCHS